MLSAKCQPFCFILKVLRGQTQFLLGHPGWLNMIRREGIMICYWVCMLSSWGGIWPVLYCHVAWRNFCSQLAGNILGWIQFVMQLSLQNLAHSCRGMCKNLKGCDVLVLNCRVIRLACQMMNCFVSGPHVFRYFILMNIIAWNIRLNEIHVSSSKLECWKMPCNAYAMRSVRADRCTMS